MPGNKVPTNVDPSAVAPPLNPVILSSHFELLRITSWVMGFGKSLLPIDLGLQLTVFSECRLLPPLMTSLRFAMDLEQPHLPGFRVKMVDKWFLDFGSWTTEESVLQWNDFFKENQTVDMASSSSSNI